MDKVTQRFQNDIGMLKGRLSGLKARQEKTEAAIVRPSGGTRPSFAVEAVARGKEIASVEARIADFEAGLKEAIADEGRRGQEREAAADLNTQADELKDKAAGLLKEIASLEREEQRLRVAAFERDRLASWTPSELRREAEARRIEQEAARRESLRGAEYELRSCEAALRNAEQEVPMNEARIIRCRQELAFAQRGLEELKGAVGAAH